MCQVGRLVRRQGEPSNVEVGPTTYPVDRGSVGRDRRKGSEGRSHKEEKTEGGNATEEEVSIDKVGTREGGLYMDTCTGAPSSQLCHC